MSSQGFFFLFSLALVSFSQFLFLLGFYLFFLPLLLFFSPFSIVIPTLFNAYIWVLQTKNPPGREEEAFSLSLSLFLCTFVIIMIPFILPNLRINIQTRHHQLHHLASLVKEIKFSLTLKARLHLFMRMAFVLIVLL